MLYTNFAQKSAQNVITSTLDLLFKFQLTLQAKKKAEEASKQAIEVSKNAAGVSKNTIEDLTYVGKSTLGDLTKTAKEAAAKKGLVKNDPNQQNSPPPTTVANSNSSMIASTGKDFFSSISSDMNTIAHSTTNMFSGLFGNKNNQQKGQQSNQQQQQKPKETKISSFDPFPGRKGLVERWDLFTIERTL